MDRKPNSRPDLKEGEDYYIDPESGNLTFTAAYLKKCGFCCERGCRHCPYRSEPVESPVQ